MRMRLTREGEQRDDRPVTSAERGALPHRAPVARDAVDNERW